MKLTEFIKKFLYKAKLNFVTQDIRKMGGLISYLPFTYSIMLIGTLSLLAIPWLTGFWSKDLIIELAYVQYKFTGIFAFLIGSLTAGLTAFYSYRLISMVFINYPNSSLTSYINIHESKIIVIIPLLILSLFSIFFGFIFYDFFVGIGSDFLSNSINIKPTNITLIEAEFSIPILFKLFPLIISLIGASLSLYLYQFRSEILIELIENKLGKNIYTFLNGKYFFDILYNNYFISGGLKIGYFISKELDRGLFELIGPFGISLMLTKLSNNLAKLDTGLITNYALYIVLGLFFIIYLIFAPILIDSSIITEFRLIFIYLSALFFIY